jgi:hypothetical protein
VPDANFSSSQNAEAQFSGDPLERVTEFRTRSHTHTHTLTPFENLYLNDPKDLKVVPEKK